MIQLSGRLQIIADRIEQGETMGDIGTDHGFLPVYLRQKGKCPKVIVADISIPSLEKARKNARYYGFSEDAEIAFRVGDGLSVLAAAEVDCVVIAGMGGKLIRDIMTADLTHTVSFRKFILQPRIGQGYLRKWLTDNGFSIIAEDLVVEGRHIPEIITVLRPGEDTGERLNVCRSGMGFGNPAVKTAGIDGSDIRWIVPPWIIDAEGPVQEFLQRKIEAGQLKLENVKRAKVRDPALEREVREDNMYLQGLLKEYEDGKQEKG